MSDYECPKCKTEYEASGSHEDDSGEHRCDECGFRFVVTIEYEALYEAGCVECEYGDATMHPGCSVPLKRCKHCENFKAVEVPQ